MKGHLPPASHVTEVVTVVLQVGEVAVGRATAREVVREIAREVVAVNAAVITEIVTATEDIIAIPGIHGEEMMIKIDIHIKNIRATAREIVAAVVMKNAEVEVVKEVADNDIVL